MFAVVSYSKYSDITVCDKHTKIVCNDDATETLHIGHKAAW